MSRFIDQDLVESDTWWQQGNQFSNISEGTGALLSTMILVRFANVNST